MRLLVDLKPSDPALGLAIEEVLLDVSRRDGCEAIRVWVNERAVVLGRSQSIAAEVDEAQAEVLGIPILRRISGGGTVYHYPGNLNVSLFLRTRTELSEVSVVFGFFGGLLTEALARLAPKLYHEDNGLYADGLKVGGAAQARRGAAVLYHTTLLIGPSPIPMETLLLAMQPGYHSERISSVPRATTSLSEHLARSIEPSEIVGPIIDALASALSVRPELGRLTRHEEAQATALRQEKYGSSAWNRKL